MLREQWSCKAIGEIHEGFDKEWGTHFALCSNDSLKVCETYQLPTSIDITW